MTLLSSPPLPCASTAPTARARSPSPGHAQAPTLGRRATFADHLNDPCDETPDQIVEHSSGVIARGAIDSVDKELGLWRVAEIGNLHSSSLHGDEKLAGSDRFLRLLEGLGHLLLPDRVQTVKPLVELVDLLSSAVGRANAAHEPRVHRQQSLELLKRFA